MLVLRHPVEVVNAIKRKRIGHKMKEKLSQFDEVVKNTHFRRIFYEDAVEDPAAFRMSIAPWELRADAWNLPKPIDRVSKADLHPGWGGIRGGKLKRTRHRENADPEDWMVAWRHAPYLMAIYEQGD
jgi:hypothetical protein